MRRLLLIPIVGACLWLSSCTLSEVDDLQHLEHDQLVVDLVDDKLVVVPAFRARYEAHAAVYGNGVEGWPIIPPLNPVVAFANRRDDGNYVVSKVTYREMVQMTSWRISGAKPLAH